MDSAAQTVGWQIPQSLEAAAAKPAAGTTAVLVCHGMGKQFRFQSLNDVIMAVSAESQSRWGTTPNVRTGQVKSGDNWIPRAEVTIADGQGRQREVHIFESYWAPLTEGKVTARDVTRFLFTAAWQGIRHSLGEGFDRWMFGRPQRFRYPITTLLGIIGSFVLICAIWGLYAVLVSSAVGFFTQLYQSSAFATGMPLWESLKSVWSILSWQAVLWFVLLIIAWGLRGLYVQYVGDVAAYVSSHDVSKFNDIRGEIQDSVCGVAKTVYHTKQPAGAFMYDRVVVVAHSLGSLIAYDALNRLMNEELAETGTASIPGRTKLFLTFGSPLDKIAFIFRIQKKNSVIREAFAAGKQPMILDYAYRPERWVNLYSAMDPVSGRLDFYDMPTTKTESPPNPKRIENRRDPKAWIPVWAHVQYWDNPLVRRILTDELAP